MHLLKRFFLRTLRILGGFIVLLIALYGIGAAWELLEKPLASTSMLELIGGLGVGILSAWGCFFAFCIAFGEMTD